MTPTVDLEARTAELRGALDKAADAAAHERYYTPVPWENQFYAVNILEQGHTLQQAEALAAEFSSDGRKRRSKRGQETIRLLAEACQKECEYRLSHNEALDNDAFLDKVVDAAGRTLETLAPLLEATDPAMVNLSYVRRTAKTRYVERISQMGLRADRGFTREKLLAAVDHVRDLRDAKLGLDLGTLLGGPNDPHGLYEDALVWANQKGKPALVREVAAFVESDDPARKSVSPYILEKALDISLMDASEFDTSRPEVDQLLAWHLAAKSKAIHGQTGAPLTQEAYDALLKEALTAQFPDAYMTQLTGMRKLMEAATWARERAKHPELLSSLVESETLYKKWAKDFYSQVFLGEKDAIIVARDMGQIDRLVRR